MARKASLTEQPVNIRLPRELHEAVIARANADDRTMAELIRVAIRYFLKETKPIAPS